MVRDGRLPIPTGKAYELVNAVDETLLGTIDYMGVAWFWNYAYRHYLRDASYGTRRKVHHAFVDAGLELSGESDLHLSIVQCLAARKRP